MEVCDHLGLVIFRGVGSEVVITDGIIFGLNEGYEMGYFDLFLLLIE